MGIRSGSRFSGTQLRLGSVILESGLMMCHKEASWRVRDHGMSAGSIGWNILFHCVMVLEWPHGSQCDPSFKPRLTKLGVRDGLRKLRLAEMERFSYSSMWTTPMLLRPQKDSALRLLGKGVSIETPR